MLSNILLIGVGVVVGLLSGLFGVGGSSIATPLLRLIDVSRMVALASPLLVSFPTALIGGLMYRKRGMIHTNAVQWTAVGGMPTVVLGAYLSSEVPGRVLMLLTGLFVVTVGAWLLHKSPDGQIIPPCKRENRNLFILTGIVTGIFSGLLANGGGFLLLPAYLILFRFSPQEAAATSLVAVSFLSIPGTIVHYFMGHIDLKVAALVALGVIPSTIIGARIGLSLSKEKARRYFGLFLLAFGVFFMIRTIYRVEMYGWF